MRFLWTPCTVAVNALSDSGDQQLGEQKGFHFLPHETHFHSTINKTLFFL